jgi:hypothetical protein
MATFRNTRFPESDDKGVSEARKEEEITTWLAQRRAELASITEESDLPIAADTKGKAAQIPPPFPVKVNPSSPTPSKPPPSRYESPWNTYISLHPLNRGGKVIAAYSKEGPVKMVAIKKLASDIKDLASTPHKNLLAVLELYKYNGELFVITDYTVVSLMPIIACPMRLEEDNVSATCRQASFFILPQSIPLTDYRSSKE